MTNDPVIRRLRGANPIPSAAHADADSLFDAITAMPADSRVGAREASPRRRRALMVAIVVGAMALITSTAVAAYQEFYSAPMVKPRVTHHEYQKATHELTLPPGMTWPDFHMPPNSVTSQGGGGSAALFVSQHAWECYWVDAIRSGDGAAGDRAHAELQAILDHNVFVAPNGASESWAPRPAPKVPYAVYADDGGLQWIQQAYTMAAAGHPQRLIQSCTANG
jgi:hypothetical protein